MKTCFYSECGIVMMEFIIVFPIYLILFAVIMAVGDTLVHSIRLPSAERTAAFDVGENGGKGWERVVDTLFPQTEISDDGSRQDNPVQEGVLDHSADTTIEGPWAMTAGVKVRNTYKLPVGGTAGQLLFFGGMGDLTSTSGVSMYSKNVVTTYNYVTLKRRRDMDGVSWRDYGRNASDLLVYGGLVDKEWKRGWEKVSEEEWNLGSAQTSNRGDLKGNPELGKTASYTRYPQFVTWSD